MLAALGNPIDPAANTADMFADGTIPVGAELFGDAISYIPDSPLDETDAPGGGTFRNAVNRGEGGVEAATCDTPDLPVIPRDNGDNIADMFGDANVFVAGERVDVGLENIGDDIVGPVSNRLIFCVIEVPVFDCDAFGLSSNMLPKPVNSICASPPSSFVLREIAALISRHVLT